MRFTSKQQLEQARRSLAEIKGLKIISDPKKLTIEILCPVISSRQPSLDIVSAKERRALTTTNCGPPNPRRRISDLVVKIDDQPIINAKNFSPARLRQLKDEAAELAETLNQATDRSEREELQQNLNALQKEIKLIKEHLRGHLWQGGAVLSPTNGQGSSRRKTDTAADGFLEE